MQAQSEVIPTAASTQSGFSESGSTGSLPEHMDHVRPAISAKEKLRQLVASSLRFQRRWQRISMSAYVGSTVGVLLSTTLATYFAAREQAQLAALLAASSTVLVGVEKSLLFREKWKFHLFVATKLSVLQIKLDLVGSDLDRLTTEYTDILSAYANSIPISTRDSQ